MEDAIINLIVQKIDDLKKDLGEKLDENTRTVKITNGQITELKRWRGEEVDPVIKGITAGKKHIGEWILQALDLFVKGAILFAIAKFSPVISDLINIAR